MLISWHINESSHHVFLLWDLILWSHYCWGHILQQSPTCPRQVCVTNSLVLLQSPSQCKLSCRSFLHVIISKVVSSIWRVTVWPELSAVDTFRAWPCIFSSLLLEWPWDLDNPDKGVDNSYRTVPFVQPQFIMTRKMPIWTPYSVAVEQKSKSIRICADLGEQSLV